MYLKPGELFADKYHIIKRLGRGGMGVIYRAVDKGIEREVAIKSIRARLLSHVDPSVALQRFRREAAMVARVQHPGVMRLFEYGLDEDEVPYIVSEFINGKELDYAVIDPKMTDEQLWSLWYPFLDAMDQLLEILAEVHRVGVIHRDLKPANIMLQETYGGTALVRVLDFGLARLIHGSRPVDPMWMKKLTKNALGTLYYMAPEQFVEDGELLPQTDLYAVGVMLYTGLSGRLPFPEDVPRVRTIKRRVFKPAPPVPAIVPEPLRRFIARAIERKPADRFEDALAMRDALRRAIEESEPPVQRPTRGIAKLDGAPGEVEDAAERPADEVTTQVDPELARHLNTCVVVMPRARDPKVQTAYDQAFERVIKPAIGELTLPESGAPLQVRRVDANDLVSGRKRLQEVEQLEYARVVLWEKSHLDTGGLRLLAYYARLGLVGVLHLLEQPVPLELQHLPAASYSIRADRVEHGRRDIRELVARALRERWRPRAMSFVWNQSRKVIRDLGTVTGEVIEGDETRALEALERLVQRVPENPVLRYRRADLQARSAKSEEDWKVIVNELQEVVDDVPEFAPAWKQLGVAWSRIGKRQRALRCLSRSVEIDPQDYDGRAALGGVLKRHADALRAQTDRVYDEAIHSYEQGMRISRGHPYPLLNWIRMTSVRRGTLALDAATIARLEQIVEERGKQASSELDLPWCYFDKAEAELYLGRMDAAKRTFDRAARRAGPSLTPGALESFADTLGEVKHLWPTQRGVADLVETVNRMKGHPGAME